MKHSPLSRCLGGHHFWKGSIADCALEGAIKSKKDADTVKVLNGLKETLLSYRAAGKPVGLTGDDWGVGDIPDCKSEAGGTGKMSACAVGSSFGNANPNLYNRNVKKRAQ